MMAYVTLFLSIFLFFTNGQIASPMDRIVTGEDDYCQCELMGQIGEAFCEIVDLKREASIRTECHKAQSIINQLWQAEGKSCELDVCNDHPVEFYTDLCQKLEDKDYRSGCNAVLSERRNLNGDNGDPGCFDENVEVITRSGSKKLRDLQAGEEILTCDQDVFATVLAKVDHFDFVKKDLLKIDLADGRDITLTSRHMVFSEGNLIPADTVRPGMNVDGQPVIKVTTVKGRRMNAITFRSDIMVNGICSTWVEEEFLPVLQLQFLWDRMNPLARFYPQFVVVSLNHSVNFLLSLADRGYLGDTPLLGITFTFGFALVFLTYSFGLLIAFGIRHVIGLLLGDLRFDSIHSNSKNTRKIE